MFLLVLLTVLQTASLIDCIQTATDGRVRLHSDLFQHYNSYVRPVLDPTQPVNVEIDVIMGQLIHLDEPAQVFTGKWYLHMSWYDEFLKWNQTEYDNVSHIMTYAEDVWTPDIRIENSVDPRRPNLEIDKHTKLRIFSDGWVDWQPEVIVLSACDINVAAYPFDEQICKIELKPYLYINKEVSYHYRGNVTTDGKNTVVVTDLTYLLQHSLWKVPNQECISRVWSHTGTDFPIIICKVHMLRKAYYYNFNIVVPIIVLLTIGSLCFLLPINDAGRVGLSLTVLLSMTVFLMLIMDNLPVVSDSIPLLQVFICLAMMILGGATVASVAILALYNRTTGELGTDSHDCGMITMPHPVMAFIYLRILAKCVFVRCNKVWFIYKAAMKRYEDYHAAIAKTKASNSKALNVDQDGEGDMDGLKTPNMSSEGRCKEMDGVFKKVWIVMAIILNRVCLVLYVLSIIVMILYVLCKALKKKKVPTATLR